MSKTCGISNKETGKGFSVQKLTGQKRYSLCWHEPGLIVKLASFHNDTNAGLFLSFLESLAYNGLSETMEEL